MLQKIILYVLTLVPLVVLDALWLGVIGKGFYQKWLGHLFAPSPNWIPALVFYPLYAIGMYIFIVHPKINAPLWEVFLLGAFFGLIAYSAYDLTNHATLREWPLVVTIVDMLWGALATGLASVFAVWISRIYS